MRMQIQLKLYKRQGNRMITGIADQVYGFGENRAREALREQALPYLIYNYRKGG